MTHKDLVSAAVNWLETEHKCPLVFPELKVTAQKEIPDVIGFFDDGITVVIECKTSKANFTGDKKKPYRKYPEDGLGDYRYFAVTENVRLYQDEIPKNWGLIFFDKHGSSVEIEPERFDKSNKRSESALLVAAIRLMGVTTAFYHRVHPFIQIGPQLFNGKRISRKSRNDIEERKRMTAMYEAWVKKTEAEAEAKEQERIKANEEYEKRKKEYEEWRSDVMADYNDNFPSPTGEFIVPIVM